ncbi:MAG: hypothetical protein QOJ39_749, partial [Candidatus Eremiobacteraeota bacterium]|nr:hypothetical protein [Candidatus Eremiobacteraeota bacterium]
MTQPAPAPARFATHAAVTFAGLMGANILGYLFYAIVSRVLGVEAYGSFSSIMAVVLMLSAPALIGQLVVAKLATDLTQDPDRLAALVRGVERISLAVSLCAGAALAIASVPLAGFLRVDDPLLVTFAGASLCGALALPFLRGVLQGTSSFASFALSNVAENAAKALFAPVLGLVGGSRGAMGGVALAYAAATLYTLMRARPRRPKSTITFPLRGVARDSVGVALAVFCINVLLLYDVVLAKRYLDPYTAGLYGAAALSSRTLFSVIAFVPTVLLPQVAMRSARAERTRFLFLQAACVAGAIAAAAVGFFALFP